MRKQIKAKEPIKIRFKKLAKGNKSIYLDYYKNGCREYEFLGLYLIAEKTPLDKIANKNTLAAATKIKADRIVDLINGVANIKHKKNKILLQDYFINYTESRHITKIDYTLKAVMQITKTISEETKKITLSDIDKKYCLHFLNYLTDESNKGYKGRLGKSIKLTTAKAYYSVFNKVLNKAVKDGYININPFTQVDKEDKIKASEAEREYLTTEEVQRLINTPLKTKYDIKEAFLFSCFTGLRISDIRKLSLNNITTDKGVKRLILTQQKTKNINSFILSEQSLKWLPTKARQKETEPIFKLPTKKALNKSVKIWADEADIAKNISFHTARHTFATMMLTFGVDLYTTSKLLGHTNITTTQIYAKIVDKKKDEAINLVDKIFKK